MSTWQTRAYSVNGGTHSHLIGTTVAMLLCFRTPPWRKRRIFAATRIVMFCPGVIQHRPMWDGDFVQSRILFAAARVSIGEAFYINLQTSNISHTKIPSNVSRLAGVFARSIEARLRREWICSWSSTDRWCSNYIWVIKSFIAYCHIFVYPYLSYCIYVWDKAYKTHLSDRIVLQNKAMHIMNGAHPEQIGTNST